MSSLVGCVRVTIRAGAALRACARRSCTGLALGDDTLCRACRAARRAGRG